MCLLFGRHCELQLLPAYGAAIAEKLPGSTQPPSPTVDNKIKLNDTELNCAQLDGAEV